MAHRFCTVDTHEADYIEWWPNPPSDISVKRYCMVECIPCYVICTSWTLGHHTCQQACQQENTIWAKHQNLDRASTLHSMYITSWMTHQLICTWTKSQIKRLCHNISIYHSSKVILELSMLSFWLSWWEQLTLKRLCNEIFTSVFFSIEAYLVPWFPTETNKIIAQ